MRIRRLAAVLIATCSAVIALAPAAGGVTLIETGRPAGVWLLPDVWHGGCLVTYRVDSTAAAFKAAVPYALAELTTATGIDFTPVAGPADITFKQHPQRTFKFQGVQAIGAWDKDTGTVWLTAVAPFMRRYLVLHEAMHALGAGHSETGNVMDAVAVTYTFGADDVDTLTSISEQNGCSA